MSARRWIVSQIGAREHYAVPRALHERNLLRHLFTDAWCDWGRSLLRALPEPARSLANRYHPDLPREAVTAFTSQALFHRIQSVFASIEPGSPSYYTHHRHVGAQFARNVRRTLRKSGFALNDSVFFGYNTGSLETLDFLEGTNCLTVLDQIDPGCLHKKIVQEEAERWPKWAQQVPVVQDSFEERLEAEWELASVIVVNSEWSKHALSEQGVPPEKLEVVPLAYESPVEPSDWEPKSVDLPIQVLWLGSVVIAKGIQYLIEAARTLKDAPVQFTIVGPIGITDYAVANAPPNVNFVGRVPRNETESWYHSADVFVLPTLSDGFAITQLEAMAHGLPVVTTPNCGKVVTDGVDGFRVPPRSTEALVEVFENLLEKPERLEHMGERALQKAQEFTLDRVVNRLEEIVAVRNESPR